MTYHYSLDTYDHGRPFPIVADRAAQYEAGGSTYAEPLPRFVKDDYFALHSALLSLLRSPVIPTESGYDFQDDEDAGGETGVLDETSALGVADMVPEIQEVLGLTAAQVAQCVGVSRPALYKHINNEPPRDMTSYHRIYQLARRIRDEIGVIGKGHKTVLVDGKTLLRHICDRPEDTDYLLSVAGQVKEKLEHRQPGEAISPTEQRLISRSITKGG